MYMLCTAVNVAYRCNCCVAGMLPSWIQLSSYNSPSDHLTLPEDLNRLATWAENWQMTFNIQKCSIMQMTKCQLVLLYNTRPH